MTKKETRAAAKAAFEEWTSACPEGPQNASESIWQQVEASSEFRSASTVLVYMSIRGEVLTRDFIDRWHTRKRIAIPLVKGDTLTLKLYDPSRLVEGYRGIIEPSDDAEEIATSEIDLAIVPGAAFKKQADGQVLRLGRGGGFYDRLLPLLNCPAFGVCYSCRLMDDIPTDPWDRPLDGLFTENNHD